MECNTNTSGDCGNDEATVVKEVRGWLTAIQFVVVNRISASKGIKNMFKVQE